MPTVVGEQINSNLQNIKPSLLKIAASRSSNQLQPPPRSPNICGAPQGRKIFALTGQLGNRRLSNEL